METQTMLIGILTLGTMLLTYLFMKSDDKSLFGKLPAHVEITGFSIKNGLSDTKNKYYIERFRDSSKR
ncbi:hypothetical protein [Sporomusa malonica]|uniref:Uncharacterized protein n=1 Tax=Sporomusa malonica TaxID=112901 RepID=A0A1W2DUF2_9FIRM|nr:hypothetical protein [Sporomusa malonica]SMD01043.1 hypothetical protein SAMN04488500_11862 [Sporomusa malonica]